MTQPQSQTIANGSQVTFTAVADGGPPPTVQWYVSTDGGATSNKITGATSTSYSFTVNPLENNNLYWAVFTNPYGVATTAKATLTVFYVVTQPTSTVVATNSPATLTGLSSDPAANALGVQWQLLVGSTYVDFSGANSTTFNYTPTAAGTYTFRERFTNSLGEVIYTNSVTVTAT